MSRINRTGERNVERNGTLPDSRTDVNGIVPDDLHSGLPEPTKVPRSSTEDRGHLESFQRKLQVVRDRVGGVANRYSCGFFLWGPGGVSKSYTVIDELKALNANYRVSNSRMTGRGLFDLLDQYPDCNHVLEDVEQMMADKNAVGVPRSALWGQRPNGGRGPLERWITWSAYGHQREILFTGGLIIISISRCSTWGRSRPSSRA